DWSSDVCSSDLRNPYDTSRSAGGSSGGAAAALAAGLHPIADGSDMGGSLRNPASFCNVVGLRPTPGRVPAWPATLLWEPLGTPGPMGRTVADTALLLSVVAGPDPRTPTALESPGAPFAEVPETGPAGVRVALAPGVGGARPGGGAVAAGAAVGGRVVGRLGAAGGEVRAGGAGAEAAFRAGDVRGVHLAFGELID